MLFPDVGLAIKLCHGACVSWDGREVRHGISVARGVTNGDTLYSYYFGIHALVSGAVERLRQFEAAVECRSACGSSYPEFEVGMDVWVLLRNGSVPPQVREGRVLSVTDMLHVAFYGGEDVREPGRFRLDDANVVVADLL